MEEAYVARTVIDTIGGGSVITLDVDEIPTWISELEASGILTGTDGWDTYANPFETKDTYTRKDHPILAPAWDFMESRILDTARGLLDLPGLQVDESRHYAGLFRYNPGGQLSVHVDAGIHPLSPKGQPMRKRVTALLYLGRTQGGGLEFWDGWPCTDDPAFVNRCSKVIWTARGRIVLFENHDRAWHSVASNDGSDPRYVLTVSYLLAEPSRPVPGYENMRMRAYFTARPMENWTPDMYRLRNLRADPERYAEAYRTK